MREIKFRAWWNDTGKPVEDFNSEYIIDSCNEEVFTVEQFTGLHDKNGKEVYEGDIDDARGICIWDEDDCCWCWQEIETGYTNKMLSISGEFNIVGNIHENPELLEANK